jgi:hypothetical protein
VLRYAHLLLELNDEENLRSLLTRAVAACEEEEARAAAAGGGAADAATVARRRDAQRPLWDMMLRFEAVLSSGRNAPADVLAVEARRRRALYGPAGEDVIAGGEGPPDEDDDRGPGAGAHRSSLGEQLVRAEGYDVASRVANGLGRLVDALAVTGALGGGEAGGIAGGLDFAAAALAAEGASGTLWGDECAGGPSDVSYVRRLRFQREGRARAAAAATAPGLAAPSTGGGGVAGRLLSSHRERAPGGMAGAVASHAAPEWLRPLLLLLPPVPKFGRAGAARPPPHLTEMALGALRSSTLPIRPTSVPGNGKAGAGVRKRGRGFNNGGDSSDEENGNSMRGGGYSGQFRARQRSRLAGSAASTN